MNGGIFSLIRQELPEYFGIFFRPKKTNLQFIPVLKFIYENIEY